MLKKLSRRLFILAIPKRTSLFCRRENDDGQKFYDTDSSSQLKDCSFFTIDKSRCHLKAKDVEIRKKAGVVSGATDEICSKFRAQGLYSQINIVLLLNLQMCRSNVKCLSLPSLSICCSSAQYNDNQHK